MSNTVPEPVDRDWEITELAIQAEQLRVAAEQLEGRAAQLLGSLTVTPEGAVAAATVAEEADEIDIIAETLNGVSRHVSSAVVSIDGLKKALEASTPEEPLDFESVDAFDIIKRYIWRNRGFGVDYDDLLATLERNNVVIPPDLEPRFIEEMGDEIRFALQDEGFFGSWERVKLPGSRAKVLLFAEAVNQPKQTVPPRTRVTKKVVQPEDSPSPSVDVPADIDVQHAQTEPEIGTVSPSSNDIVRVTDILSSGPRRRNTIRNILARTYDSRVAEALVDALIQASYVHAYTKGGRDFLTVDVRVAQDARAEALRVAETQPKSTPESKEPPISVELAADIMRVFNRWVQQDSLRLTALNIQSVIQHQYPKKTDIADVDTVKRTARKLAENGLLESGSSSQGGKFNKGRAVLKFWLNQEAKAAHKALDDKALEAYVAEALQKYQLV